MPPRLLVVLYQDDPTSFDTPGCFLTLHMFYLPICRNAALLIRLFGQFSSLDKKFALFQGNVLTGWKKQAVILGLGTVSVKYHPGLFGSSLYPSNQCKLLFHFPLSSRDVI